MRRQEPAEELSDEVELMKFYDRGRTERESAMYDEVKGRDLAARKGSRSKGSRERELIHVLQRAKTWSADDLSEAGKEEGVDGEMI